MGNNAFLLVEVPPRDTIIHVMAIHKALEMITENPTCCPKHVDEQRRAGGHQLESSVAVYIAAYTTAIISSESIYSC